MFEFLKFWKSKSAAEVVDKQKYTKYLENSRPWSIDRPFSIPPPVRKNKVNKEKYVERNNIQDRDDSSTLLSTIVLAELLSNQNENNEAIVKNVNPGGGEFSGAGASGSWDQNDNDSNSSSDSSSSDSGSSYDSGSADSGSSGGE